MERTHVEILNGLITQMIIASVQLFDPIVGLGHLLVNKLGAVSESDPEMQKMLTSAVQYVD
ncbi:MAG: hypothetical protein AAFU33_21995, partial [Bacteroidota bacterium]